MNNATRLRRLNHLVTVLKAVPVKKFFMHRWMQKNHFHAPVEIEIPKNFSKIDCRTAGCALGWAALDKKFIKAGLTVKANKLGGNIKFKSYRHINAGMQFFDINVIEAWELFVPRKYKVLNIKTHHVITRVKKLIKKYGAMK